MSTNGLVRFIAVGIVLLLLISVGGYLLFKPSTTVQQNEADINGDLPGCGRIWRTPEGCSHHCVQPGHDDCRWTST